MWDIDFHTAKNSAKTGNDGLQKLFLCCMRTLTKKANASTVKNHLGALINIAIDNTPPCRSARAAIMGFFCVVRFMNIFILICCCSVSTMLALSCSSCRSFVMVESVSSWRLLRLRCSSATCPVNRDTCGQNSLMV